jgi:hypothetical protein
LADGIEQVKDEYRDNDEQQYQRQIFIESTHELKPPRNVSIGNRNPR